MFKGVQLAVDMPLAIRHTNDVGVIQAIVTRSFNQPYANRHLITLRQAGNSRQGRTVVNGLGQRAYLLGAEIDNVPVAGNAHFGKGQNAGPFAGCLMNKAFHNAQVIGLIISAVAELYRSHLEFVVHRSLLVAKN